MAGKTISNLNVVLGGTVAPFVRAFSGAGTTVSNFTTSVQNAGSTIMRFTGLAGGLGAAFGAIKGAASGISIASQLEQTEVAFTTMLRSGDAAAAMMKKLTAFAAETPFEFPELAQSAKSLLAFGVSAGQIEPALRKIGDISSGIGAPVAEIAEIFGKAKVQGTLFAEDINQLVGRGIPVIQQFAKQLGVSEGEVKKLASQGKISFAMLDKAFTDLTSNGGQFQGMMAAQSKTLGGLWSTFTDNVGMTTAGLVTTIVDAFRLKGALSALSNAIGTGGAWLNATVKTWAPVVVNGLNAVWTSVSAGLSKAWDVLSPYVQQVATFMKSTTTDVADAIGGASISTSDALKGVAGTIGAGALAWVSYTAAVYGSAAVLGIARGAVIALDGTMILFNATTAAAAFVQGGLVAAVAGVALSLRGAAIASTFLSGAYATGRTAVMLLAGANAGLSFAQSLVNTLTIAGGFVQLGFATALGAVRSAFAGLTIGQVAWRVATIAGTAAQWLLNAALTANPIGIVVVAIGALVGWLGYLAYKSGIVSTALGGIQTACDFVAFAFQNFGLVARAAVTGAAFELVRFGNIAVHFFSEQVPAYLSWFATNWRSVFTNAFHLASAIFTNMGKNVWAFFQAVGSWMSGKGFKFEWTGLTEGFESTLAALPKIAERQIGPLEKQLAGQFADASAQMRKGFDAYRAGKAVQGPKPDESKPPEQPPKPPTMPEPFKFPDVQLGAVDTKPADVALDTTKEKAKATHDAIANIGSGSAEQMKRIAAAQFDLRTAMTMPPAIAKSQAVAAPAATSPAIAATIAKPLPASVWPIVDAKPLLAPGMRPIVKATDYLNRNPNGPFATSAAFPLGGESPIPKSFAPKSIATPDWFAPPTSPVAAKPNVEPARAIELVAAPVDRGLRESAREQPKKDAKAKPLDGPAVLAALGKVEKAIVEKEEFVFEEF